ncbi:rod shape-determining protein RodA [bacterium C-53]|nr:rod shape-determining protein RodA [Lachnospiraceae bacterium]NBI01904.1 rod shape-determining protein RodA [Lachnospiraceae bacterium]RKJ12307.1 rod shape-determining protein RodA [bacterium C-53]
MFKRYELKNYNIKLIILAVTISLYGIMMIGSAREAYQSRQVYGLFLGIMAMLVLSLFDYSFVLNFYWLIYVFNLLMLWSVYVFGDSSNGAQRWIEVAGIRFQPSELAKILLILFYAQFIIKHKDKLNTFRVLLSMVLLFIPPFLLVYKQPDMSTSIIIIIIFCVLLFIGGLSFKIIGGVLAVVIPVAVLVLVLVLQPDQKLIKGYQQTRILAWLQPDKYSNAEGYQQQNSVTAIGSGQLMGKGYKSNVVASVKNGNFISEPQTDFIFAIVGEELGFTGCCSLIVLLALLVIECIKVGRRAKDLSGTLICAGVAANIGFQSFINIGVATAILPTTGLPLPFMSYGMTSLVSLYIGLGIVLNIGLQPVKYQGMYSSELTFDDE